MRCCRPQRKKKTFVHNLRPIVLTRISQWMFVSLSKDFGQDQRELKASEISKGAQLIHIFDKPKMKRHT